MEGSRLGSRGSRFIAIVLLVALSSMLLFPSSSLAVDNGKMGYGINFLSEYHRYDPKFLTDAVIDRDFSLFKSNDIGTISISLYWYRIEDKRGIYNDTFLSNIKRVCEIADSHGLRVLVTFHTLWSFNDSAWCTPDYVIDPVTGLNEGLAIVRDEDMRKAFLDMAQYTITYLKGTRGIWAYALLNEPWYYPRSLPAPYDKIDQRENFMTLIQAMADMVHSSGSICTVRFVNVKDGTINLFETDFKWDSRIFSSLNFISFNAYLPSSSANVETWKTLTTYNVEGCKSRGKLVWITEFGYLSDDDELQRQKILTSMNFFYTLRVEGVIPWFWRCDYIPKGYDENPGQVGKGMNLCKDFSGTPRPALLEFVKDPIFRTKSIPTLVLAGKTTYDNLLFTFYDNGTLNVRDTYKNSLSLGFPLLTSLTLNENKTHVWYSVTGAGWSIGVYFDFVKYTDRVKITIKGTSPLTLTQISFKISSLGGTKYTNMKSAGSFLVNEGVKYGIFFDWSDALTSVNSFDGTNLKLNVGKTFSIDPSLVGNSTGTSATREPWQRKTFVGNNGYHYVFFVNGTDGVYCYSADGLSGWSAEISFQTWTASGWHLSTFYDVATDKVHYARFYGNRLCYYRRGSLAADGPITWDSAEVLAVDLGASHNGNFPTIAVDSGGYPYIAYREYSGTIYTPYIIKSSTNDGTWTTASGYPLQLSTAGDTNWHPQILALTNSRMYVILVRTETSGAWGLLYNGTAWLTGTNETITIALWSSYQLTSTSNGDDVYVCYSNATNGYLKGKYRTYNTGWGLAENIYNVCIKQSTVPSWDVTNNRIYVFFAVSTSSIRYNVRYSNGTYGTQQILSSSETLYGLNCLSGSRKSNHGALGLIWLNNPSSPYSVRYAFMSVYNTYTRSVDLSLTMTLTASRIFEAIRSSSLGITMTLLPSRTVDLIRSTTLSLTSTWSASRGVTYNAIMNLPLTFDFYGWWPWPVTPVNVPVASDMRITFALLFLPIIIGIISIRAAKILAVICGGFLMIYASYLAMWPNVYTAYNYDSVTGLWSASVMTVPFHPFLEIFLILLGIFIFLAGFMSKEGE
jgi:hypothetical protein